MSQAAGSSQEKLALSALQVGYTDSGSRMDSNRLVEAGAVQQWEKVLTQAVPLWGSAGRGPGAGIYWHLLALLAWT
jgi:hypothetical protein